MTLSAFHHLLALAYLALAAVVFVALFFIPAAYGRHTRPGWSLPALSFAIWTAANLGPRARTHHRWYQQTFADYPPERRALIPKLY